MNEHILKWLEEILTNTTKESKLSSAPPLTKRKRDYRPLSPNPSTLMSQQGDESAMSVTPKKRKTTAVSLDSEDFVNTTPRAPNRFPTGDAASLSSASLTSSSRSGRSSPTKQLARLAIDPAGLEIVPLTVLDQRLPVPAREMVNNMEEVACGEGVVNSCLRKSIEAMKKGSPAYNSFRPHVFSEESGSEQIQVKAERLLEDLLEVVEKATRCQYVEQDENGWNHHVHTPLLDAAFRYSETNVGYTACMSANISQRYKIHGMISSRIDYGMYVDPCQASNTSNPKISPADLRKKTSEAISRLQLSSSEASINHTDFSPLRRIPLCISVETKRYGGEERKAEHQLGLWLAAQWKLLAEQIGPQEAPAAAQQEGRTYDEGGRNLDLPFLPGIIVQGHDWKMVMSTQEGEKTLLWTSVTFGTTRTALDAFKIVAGLRVLFEWAEGYADWYRTHVLKVASRDIEKS